MSSTEKYEHFLQKSLVRGKIVKVPYFSGEGAGSVLRKIEGSRLVSCVHEHQQRVFCAQSG